MGKTPVSIKIDGEALRQILKDHDLNFSERARLYGVTRQAVNDWFTEGRIPPRALCELAIDLKLSPEQLDQIVLSTREERHERAKQRWQITIEEL